MWRLEKNMGLLKKEEIFNIQVHSIKVKSIYKESVLNKQKIKSILNTPIVGTMLSFKESKM